MHAPAIPSLANSTADRVIEILLLFSYEKPAWTALELAQKMDMPRSTVYRYLGSLKNSQLILEDGDGSFRLGPKIQVLASVGRATTSYLGLAREEMLKLSDRFNETVLFNELVDFDVVTLERIESRQRIRLASTRGSLLPWPATASAKLFLAYASPEKLSQVWSLSRPHAYTSSTIVDKDALLYELKKIAHEGYAYSDEERDEGVVGVSVPIITGHEVKHCLSMVAPKFRVGAQNLEQMRDALLETAKVITRHRSD